MAKNLFIAYSEADKEHALQLHGALKGLIGLDSWIRDIDLDGGDIFIEAINDAATEATFFLVLMSRSSADSMYLRTEANYASLRAVQDLGVRLIVIHVDDSPFPRHLEIALGSQYNVKLDVADSYKTFMELAEYIENHLTIPVSSDVYVDRGEIADEFALTARRHQLIFILGPSGVGKTSFVLKSISQRLQKRPLTVKLSKGHSLDVICRKILSASHNLQLRKEASDEELLESAVTAIRARADRFFLFLDNAEEGLDAENQLLAHVEQLASTILAAELPTHIIFATTRSPDIPVDLAHAADVLVLRGLAPRFAREQIELLIGEGERLNQILKAPEFGELVRLSAGYPLAAKLLSSMLKVRTPSQITQGGEWQKFELKLALHILQITNGAVLGEVEKLVLQILAAVQEPLSMQDVMASSDLCPYGIDEIQKARVRLADLFLIEEMGELMSLHPFLQVFFTDQLSEDPKLRERIMHDLGMHSLKRAVILGRRVQDARAAEQILVGDQQNIEISSAMLRYAIPATRLLRSIGREDLVENLPLEIKGTIREMVFYFYQERHDYTTALNYAERWLTISPSDTEIALFRARCYRNFRDPSSLAKANGILDTLQSNTQKPYLKAKIFRDMALVQQHLGNRQKAKEFFNEGINASKSYTENYVGLAELLLKEADELPLYEKKREAMVRRAVQFLDEVRKRPNPITERLHVGLYVEALIEAGEEDRALPILKDALSANPDDPRLNYRMAEILRRQGAFAEATEFSQKAKRLGHPKIALTSANILVGKAYRLLQEECRPEAHKMLGEALDVLKAFVPEYGTDKEVADTISAKIYRMMGEFSRAAGVLSQYSDSINPYTIYETAKIDLLLADSEPFDKRDQAVDETRALIKRRISEYGKKYVVPAALEQLVENLDKTQGGEIVW